MLPAASSPAISAVVQTPIAGSVILPGSPDVWPPGAVSVAWTCTSLILCPWLTPSPDNSPNLVWDITQKPTTAKRITGRRIVTDLSPKFGDQATYPGVETVRIHCDRGIAKDFWDPIVIEKGNAVNVWDILNAIYEYYQIPMSEQEVQYVSSLHDDNYQKMTDACYRRCSKTPSLPGYELRQGIKRADCLGENTKFFGMWITHDADSNWHLDLGLTNS